jgi:hypothetical protein
MLKIELYGTDVRRDVCGKVPRSFVALSTKCNLYVSSCVDTEVWPAILLLILRDNFGMYSGFYYSSYR